MGIDAPTVRMIRRFLWAEVKQIPPDAADESLPTYGKLRRAVEKKLGERVPKDWREWFRRTVDVMMDRAFAGLDFD